MGARKTTLDQDSAALISRALADPNRFAMLRRIAQAEQTVTCSSVCEWLELAPATVSHHLKELENAGLVQVSREGKFARLTIRRDVWDAYLHYLAKV